MSGFLFTPWNHKLCSGTEAGGSREPVQDVAGKDDCAGCGCGFLRRTAAEMRVMTRPTGRGSRNVIAEL